MTIGATLDPAGGVLFRIWAPAARRAQVVIYGPDAETLHELRPEENGYLAGRVEDAGAGTRYKFRLNDGDSYPDPASRRQPDGVHGPSEVWDPGRFRWTDEAWRGEPADNLVIYELHLGTFTPEGSFRSAIGRLGAITELGANAVEIMPIANFSGERNWGYDGVNLFAPATTYGTPDDFKAFVDAAHAFGLAVILDVVYNHLGPEGNYLPAITGGRFFTDRHHTPWGDAVNYDGPASAGVRNFIIQNALYWVNEYHVDGLRLDATHAILDDSPVHLLQELSWRVRGSVARPVVLIAEDERNERRLVLPSEEGGYGLDAVWADDLHHQLRRHLAGDSEGYFASYGGSIEDVAATLRKGWFYEGQENPSGEARGTPADDLPPRHFVHCIQNHDQVGNRPFGDRLTDGVSLEAYRAVSALLLLSPYTPLLWMGQEWAATTPFLYFTDHPEGLGELVTEGRREEFRHFSAFGDPEKRHEIPDPQAVATFERSKLHWQERERAPHAGVFRLYQELVTLRARHPALRPRGREGFRADGLGEHSLLVRREAPEVTLLVVASLEGGLELDLAATDATRAPEGTRWSLVLSTEETRYGGSGGAGLDGGLVRMGGAGAVVLEARE